MQRNNLDKVIEQTVSVHTQEAINEKYGEQHTDSCPEEYYCFDDIIQQYNKGISEDEIKAWVWYKRFSGGYNYDAAILNKKNGWSKYVIPLSDIPNHLDTWLEEGVVCYQNGKYIPAVLYLSLIHI